MIRGDQWVMKASEKALGEDYSKKFTIGDLVSWVEFNWTDYGTGETTKHSFHGILIDLVIKESGGRQVSFARVMPNTRDTILEISVIRIRKFGTI